MYYKYLALYMYYNNNVCSERIKNNSVMSNDDDLYTL